MSSDAEVICGLLVCILAVPLAIEFWVKLFKSKRGPK